MESNTDYSERDQHNRRRGAIPNRPAQNRGLHTNPRRHDEYRPTFRRNGVGPRGRDWTPQGNVEGEEGERRFVEMTRGRRGGYDHRHQMGFGGGFLHHNSRPPFQYRPHDDRGYHRYLPDDRGSGPAHQHPTEVLAAQNQFKQMGGRAGNNGNRRQRTSDWSFYNQKAGFGKSRMGIGGPQRTGRWANDNPDASEPAMACARSVTTAMDEEDQGDKAKGKGPGRQSQMIASSTSEKKCRPIWRSKGGCNDDDATQRERLTEDLFSGSYECMVCCERVRPDHAIWNCQNCYNIFHLGCIKKWGRSSMLTDDTGWRCPGCQNVTNKVPHSYYCFCGKLRDPEWNRYDTPHGCGEQCAKKRAPNTDCVHPCNLLCHPGPCPPCGTYVPCACFCKKSTQQVRCSQANSISCGETCNRLLNCGKHRCADVCHSVQCKPCDRTVVQKCGCDREMREIACDLDVDEDGSFLCGGLCGRSLECGNHICERPCHSGECKTCERSPEVMTHCPCGQTQISELLIGEQMRSKCTDAIPTCNKVCGKQLSCGPEGDPHKCPSVCHLGPCVPCPLTSSVVCRCKALTKKIPCVELTRSGSLLCEKRCTVKKTCGRHKCLQLCCVDSVHVCRLICGHRLKCGLHTCEEPCHQGNCPTCWNAGFDELTCHCGATVMYPPIPCGTKPPECNKPCTRLHPCGHPVRHNCHSGPQCPPCTFLTEKWCYGKHELRTCIPCFQYEVCCGLPCNKLLPCGQHKCKLICHLGTCTKEGFTCTQPCLKLRPQCGHPCGSRCHEGNCPMNTCKAPVRVRCKCGHRNETMTCAENTKACNRLVSTLLAAKLHLSDGESVDLSQASSMADTNAILDCNNGCLLIERNRRLAAALQLRNPDLSNNVQSTVYSEFLKEQAKANATFVASVYNRLAELVLSAKKKSRSHAFPPMKSDHRRVIHELAELFGCETLSYDDEPKKNVAATAFRDRSWLPSVSIMTVIQKESGACRPAGKAPPPIPHRHTRSVQALDNSSTSNSTAEQEPIGPKSSVAAAAEIDYFDYTN